jgi:hypothetical protein
MSTRPTTRNYMMEAIPSIGNDVDGHTPVAVAEQHLHRADVVAGFGLERRVPECATALVGRSHGRH